MALTSIVKVLALVALLAPGSFAPRGEIVTCSSWKLNRHRSLREFIKGKGGGTGEPAEVKQYSDISVTFRHGHHPELHIYDDENSLVEKVDLTKVGNDMDAIRLLFEEKGFTPMPDAVGDAIGETAAPTKDEV